MPGSRSLEEMPLWRNPKETAWCEELERLVKCGMLLYQKGKNPPQPIFSSELITYKKGFKHPSHVVDILTSQLNLLRYLDLIQGDRFNRQSPDVLLNCCVRNCGDGAENDTRFGHHIFNQLRNTLCVHSIQRYERYIPLLAHLNHNIIIHRVLICDSARGEKKGILPRHTAAGWQRAERCRATPSLWFKIKGWKCEYLLPRTYSCRRPWYWSEKPMFSHYL